MPAAAQMVTQSELARHLGVSPTAVAKARDAGRITPIGDRYDLQVALIQWDRNRQRRRNDQPKAPDAAGADEQRYLPANRVLMVATSEVRGYRAYGRIENIEHIEGGDQKVDVYHSEYASEDKSAKKILSESAPLVFGLKANAFLSATVI